MDYFKSRSLVLPVQPMDVCARGDYAAVALIDGRIALARVGENEGEAGRMTTHLWQAHDGASCRSAIFLDDFVVSGDAQGSLRLSSIERSAGASADQGKPYGVQSEGRQVEEDEEDEEEGGDLGCGTSCIVGLGDANTFAVGYDDGKLEVYDRRALGKGASPVPVAHFVEHTDFVSAMDLVSPGQQLVSTSGDGTLALFDLRKRKLVARSEDDADDEMLSVRVMKGGKKVVCGHQSGVLSIFSWGYWNDCSDRFPGHPESVDAMVKVDEDTLLTGSSDGLIRIVSVLPNKALGVVGEHLAENPIEKLCLEPTSSRTLYSISHDNVVKVWSVGELLDEDESDDGEDAKAEEEGSDSEDADRPRPQRKKHKKGKQKGGFKGQKHAERSAFFADL
ncbi:WD40 repeat domain-containing protein [Chloropicon primus]|uniref:WD40 repeat domain-containing protein n=1 Tax=Chloropicon primus TaxID=1764295 RepID=A0A5B8MMU8_9CHLO|nr:WD40 repeat domain-containing protein [Chloropicon primus]UPQ99842.1 WD40 repeat domain-containing protein [Chloropicon primus]|eukprot:QDZ20630.1 WD40 repeat domain-containing protein [Chloropicon primus]